MYHKRLKGYSAIGYWIKYDVLSDLGIYLMFKTDVYKKFATIDDKIVWYGSLNLLSYGSLEDSIMRIESIEVANELLKDCNKEPKEISIQQKLF